MNTCLWAYEASERGKRESEWVDPIEGTSTSPRSKSRAEPQHRVEASQGHIVSSLDRLHARE